MVHPVHDERPLRVAVQLRDVSRAAPRQLVPEQPTEAPRAAPECEHPGRCSRRLHADGHRRRLRGFGDQKIGVAAEQPADRAELIAYDEHEARPDPAAREPRQEPARRVGLVGQPDLDVLHITCDPRIRQTCDGGLIAGDLDRLVQGGDARVVKAVLDGVEQIRDPRLGRVVPFRRWDQVDLAAVQSPRDRALEAAPLELADRRGRGGIERGVLLARRHTPEERANTGCVRLEHLRAAVHAQEQAPRAVRPCAQLLVDVREVRPCHHGDVGTERAQILDERTQLARIAHAIRDRGPVPVEQDRLEPAIQLGARRRPAFVRPRLDGLAWRRGGHRSSATAIRSPFRSTSTIALDGIRTSSPSTKTIKSNESSSSTTSDTKPRCPSGPSTAYPSQWRSR